MISCPSCQKQVDIQDKHMGTLFSCPHCNAVFYINFEGQPEVAQAEDHEFDGISSQDSELDAASSDQKNFIVNRSDETQLEHPASANDSNYGSNYDSNYNSNYSEESSIESEQESLSSNNFALSSEHPESQESLENFDPNYAQLNEGSDSYGVDKDQDLDQNSSANFGSENPEQGFDFSRTLDQAPLNGSFEASNDSSAQEEKSFKSVPLSSALSSVDSADFSDVVEFGNSDSIKGPLGYVVVIEGIDSSQLANQFKEAITDSRFGWESGDIMKQIHRGSLILQGLSPAQASVLINRIKYLPFKISWRQDVLSNG